MKDFITAAAPWVIMGLTLAIFLQEFQRSQRKAVKTMNLQGLHRECALVQLWEQCLRAARQYVYHWEYS